MAFACVAQDGVWAEPWFDEYRSAGLYFVNGSEIESFLLFAEGYFFGAAKGELLEGALYQHF